MITYFYWLVVIGLMGAVLFILGGKYQQWKPALITSAIVLIVGFGAYYFHFQQIFVKRYGLKGNSTSRQPGKTITFG